VCADPVVVYPGQWVVGGAAMKEEMIAIALKTMMKAEERLI
jgi:hypothetical protein